MIELIKAYKYDNTYDYAKMFSSKAEQTAYFNTYQSIVLDDTDYLKEHDNFIVPYNYDELVNDGVNYVIFNNGFRDIYAFIVSKQYVNDTATRLIFEIDVIQTYMFNFNLKKSFIERKKCKPEEIPLLTDYDEGLEIGEHHIAETTNVYTKDGIYFAIFGGFKDYNVVNNVLTTTPWYNSNRPITSIDGINYPFMLIALDNDISLSSFYKYLVDLPNLLGVIRLQSTSYQVTTVDLPLVKIENNTVIKTSVSCPKVVLSIVGLNDVGGSFSVPKAEVTDFYPYTYYVLTDGETDPLIMQPQYLNGSCSIIAKFALSHTPVERYFPDYYKGSTDGNVYNITNSSVMMLPVGTNGGLETIVANANQIQQQRMTGINNLLTSAVVGGGMALAGGAAGMVMGGLMTAGSIANGITAIQENMSRNKDLELTPSTIKSYGTPSTRNAFNNNTVRVLKYTIDDKYKARLLNYIDRYGNKFNNYDTIDIRTYKGYLKCTAPDIDSSIDNLYIGKIKEVLERGVYIE
jgi:hypothetical protein